MRRYLLILIIIINTLYSCGQSKKKPGINQDPKITDIVIKNVSVITMQNNEVLKNKHVLIKDGRIISISNNQNLGSKNLLVIDGTGKYIMPSLADAHVHFPEKEADMENMMQLYLLNGVTKLRSMRGKWKHKEWREKYNTAFSIYPKLYLSAPPIRSNHDLTASQMEDLVKTAKVKGFDFIKVLSIKNQEIFAQLDASCKKYNLPIGGHFPKNASDSLIFNSNYTSFEHLGGLDNTPEHLENRLNLIKEKNILLCPTLNWYSVGSGRYTYDELRKQPGMAFIPKTTVDDWIDKTKQYRQKIGDDAYKDEVHNELKALEEKFTIIKMAHDLGINMLLSPDSSSKYMIAGFSVFAEMELLKNAQINNYDILQMATTNFAAFFQEDYGTIEAGKPADFILLNQNPLEDLNTLKNIYGLYYNGQFLGEKRLNTMRTGLLEVAQN